MVANSRFRFSPFTTIWAKFLLTYLLFLSEIFVVSATQNENFSPILRLSDGSPVRGVETPTVGGKVVTEFLGIPFAEVPMGKLRFRPPLKKRPWNKVFNATSLPNSCHQNLDTYFEAGTFFGADMWNANTKMSEDCLYLNVWVPGRLTASMEFFNDPSASGGDNGKRSRRTEKFPVMVWIFGGGFWSGTSTLNVYDGKILAAEENVIIVSMNYRVSLFGFLYLERPEAPGNVGLLDQLEALIWVKTHIEKFGGDPDEVTLFGESAGAASVHMHVLSPLSQPYFKRFILQSGSATAPWALETKEAIFERAILVAQSLNCNVTKYDPYLNVTLVLECLLNASPENLLLQEWQAFEFLDFPWTPIVDGTFLIEEPRSSLQHGRFKKSQALIGNNLDEAIYFIIYFLPSVFKKDDLFSKNHFIHSDANFEESAYKLLPAYLKRNPIVKNAILFEYKDWSLPEDSMRRQDALDKMLGDYHFTCNVNEAAQAYLKHGGVVYSYYFTHRASAQTWPRWMGVLHGYEINFIFGEPFNPAFKYTTEEKELSKRFMRYWANFARTGNPNSNPDGSWMSADVWPVYTQNQEYLTLSVNGSRIGHGPRSRQCAFWKQYIPRLLAATADLTDIELRWKQQFSKWEQEYIVDWKNEFDQFQRLNKYKYYDSDIRHCHNGHCDDGNGHL